jgi:competence protein CoiA
MQKHALNQAGHLISVFHAQKKSSYLCPSCKGVMRLRGGPLRMPHFYHLTRHCSSPSFTSPEHIHVQHTLVKALNSSDAKIERRFPLINRTADVALISKQLIFEVQVSNISKREVIRRNLEYGELGFDVIWILHDQTFNRTILSPAERYLLSRPHYYTNINQEGKGIIYDQLSLHRGNRFLFKSQPLPIDLSRFTRKLHPKHCAKELSHQLSIRRKRWGLSFGGDLFQVAERLREPRLPKTKFFTLTPQRFLQSIDFQKFKRNIFGIFVPVWGSRAKTVRLARRARDRLNGTNGSKKPKQPTTN